MADTDQTMGGLEKVSEWTTKWVWDKAIGKVVAVLMSSSAFAAFVAKLTSDWRLGVCLGIFVAIIMTLALALLSAWRQKGHGQPQGGAAGQNIGAGIAPPTDGPVAIATSSGATIFANALAVFRDIRITYIYQNHGPELFECQVSVVFYGLRKTDPTPAVLRLTTPNDGFELAKLEIPPGTVPVCPGGVPYIGKGLWANLMNKGVIETMEPYPRTAQGAGPWTVVPPLARLYCKAEIRFPGWNDMEKHTKSGVKFAFELLGEDCQKIIFTIEPWLEGTPITTTTRL